MPGFRGDGRRLPPLPRPSPAQSLVTVSSHSSNSSGLAYEPEKPPPAAPLPHLSTHVSSHLPASRAGRYPSAPTWPVSPSAAASCQLHL